MSIRVKIEDELHFIDAMNMLLDCNRSLEHVEFYFNRAKFLKECVDEAFARYVKPPMTLDEPFVEEAFDDLPQRSTLAFLSVFSLSKRACLHQMDSTLVSQIVAFARCSMNRRVQIGYSSM